MDVGLFEAELVTRIGVGDREAEAEFCQRMAPRIRLYGLRHLRSASAADDLAQHVLITVIEALRRGQVREPDKLAAFVLGTCRMTVLDGRRRSSRQASLLATFGHELVPAPPPRPLVGSDRLANCVQALRERERSVIVMAFYDEHTAGETAGALGLTDANVRVIRHRALRQLRDCMEGPR